MECRTPTPSPRAIGDGPMMVDPAFRTVVYTGNARDRLLAESPASGDACTVILPEWRITLRVHIYQFRDR